MLDVINLALPFFGLIFLGLLCGKLKQIPETGLAWMNFFLIYVSLPCLFYRVLAQTPLEQLNNPPFIVGTMLATGDDVRALLRDRLAFRRHMGEATIAGLSGAYGNIGYMGPGLALATLGPAANVPVALIFCFDTLLLFALVPFLMTLAGPRREGLAATAFEVVKRIVLHPFIIATALGVASAAIHFEPPVALDRLMQFLQNAAAPCALFVLGVTVALRPVQRMPWEVPFTIIGEADRASGRRLAAAVPARAVRSGVGLYGGADGGFASGAECLHHGAAVRHLGGAGLRLGAVRHVRVGGHADHARCGW